MNKQAIEKSEKIIAESTVKNATFNGEFCSLVLNDLEGYPTASVLTAAKSDGIRQVWFATGLASNKVQRIRNNKKASVHFGTGEHSITLVGEIEILTDEKTKKEMWYDGLESHFPTGASDENYCVLSFKTKRYNFFVDWEDNEGVI
ncbi:MAG: pyridoxamine 5'-phosphate oxidase family protein [Firmicutes bacterium]|nr:pyridoxamine 5'-phosphate oxidase family protein [Bacillota bacterium]